MGIKVLDAGLQLIAVIVCASSSRFLTFCIPSLILTLNTTAEPHSPYLHLLRFRNSPSNSAMIASAY